MCDIRCNLKIEQTAVIRHNLAQHIQYIQRFNYLELRLIWLQQQITSNRTTRNFKHSYAESALREQHKYITLTVVQERIISLCFT